MKIVIVGGVAAGAKAAAKSRRLLPDADIDIYTQDTHVSYSACGLPYYIEGNFEDYRALLVRSPEEFAKSGINVHLKHKVSKILPKTKQVLVENLDSPECSLVSYDKLILAIGARPFIPNIKHIALNNVFCHGRKISTDLKSSGLKLISIDHCSSPENYEEALQEAFGENILFYGFTNPDLAFNNINRRHIISENAKNIFNIQDAKNILFLTDDSKYKTSYDFIRNLQNSNYDIIVIPALFHGTEPFSPEDINSLKFKKNGTTRLVLAEMNLSEADPKMYYWKKSWKLNNPSWLVRRSFVNKDAYITQYWHPDWRKILGIHLQGIIQTGFSGVFLTGLHNHHYFEKQLPLE